MSKRSKPKLIAKPTDGELQILSVLWELGPSTVRQVHNQMAKHRDVGYTTVLKLLQIMMDKGLVKRDETERSHVYRPAGSPSKTRRRLAGELIDTAFAGSAKQLVIEALGARRPSADELDEIRKMLDELEGDDR